MFSRFCSVVSFLPRCRSFLSGLFASSILSIHFCLNRRKGKKRRHLPCLERPSSLPSSLPLPPSQISFNGTPSLSPLPLGCSSSPTDVHWSAHRSEIVPLLSSRSLNVELTLRSFSFRSFATSVLSSPIHRPSLISSSPEHLASPRILSTSLRPQKLSTTLSSEFALHLLLLPSSPLSFHPSSMLVSDPLS